MKTTYIYELSKNGVPFYIGKTIRPMDRKHNHKKVYGDGTTLTIIDEVGGDKHEWKPLESYWIEQYKQWGYPLINKNNGGGGMLPIHTEESIKHKHNNYYQQNKDRMRAQNRANYLKNREQRLAKIKEYTLNNPDKKRMWDENYRQLKKRGSLGT